MKKQTLKALMCCALLTTADVSAKPVHPLTTREQVLPFLLDVSPSFAGGDKALRLRAIGDLDGAISALRSASGSGQDGKRSGRSGSSGKSSTVSGKPGPANQKAARDEARRLALLGDLLLEKKQFEAAAQALSGLHQALPELSDHLLLMHGKALLGAGQPEVAVTVLDTIAPASPLKARALQLTTRAELDWGQPQAALSRLEPLVNTTPLDQLPPESLLLLGDTYLGLQNRNADALRAYRMLKLTAPLSASARRAEDGLKQLATRGLKNPPWTFDERLALAQVYFSANFNEATVERLTPLLTELRQANAPAEQQCQAAYTLGVAQQNQRQYTDSVAPLTLAASVCAEETRAKAVYRLIRADLNTNKAASALTRAQDLARQSPNQSIADDALFVVAADLQDDGKLDDAAHLYQQQLEQFPSGDMRAEAAWRLAWIDFRNLQYEKAIARVEATLSDSRFLLDTPPVSQETPGQKVSSGTTNGEMEPLNPVLPPPTPITIPGGGLTDNPRLTREAYWRARWLEFAGQKDKAIVAWTRLATQAPTDFYGALAVGRLQAIAPAAAARLLQSPLNLQAPASQYPHALRIEEQVQPVQRAIPLLQTGLQKQAVEELLPLFQQVDFADPLLLSFLLEGAGRYDLSHRVAKRVLDFNATLQPTSENRAWFFYGFPQAYPGYVQRASESQAIDPFLLTALSREESAFDADVRSWAGAMGLTQLMEATAARMARELQLPPPSREDLTHPDLNLTLGAHYLHKLLGLFDNHAGLAVPSYNAGENAVGKWLKLRGTLPFDEFVEEIPYKQTRDYVKRVLSTYQTYHYLYSRQERFISLPQALPSRETPP